jgi:hypothetical protein
MKLTFNLLKREEAKQKHTGYYKEWKFLVYSKTNQLKKSKHWLSKKNMKIAYICKELESWKYLRLNNGCS